jgi:2-aminoadipate transaminase
MDTLKASDIREILKVTQNPEMISFAGGLPAPELFPRDAIASLAAELLRSRGEVALQYSPTEGYPPLREKIAARMNAIWGTRLSPDEILITTGSQSGLDLTAKLFLDEGDAVLCESPTYLGATMAFNVFRPRWVEIPTDDDGMQPEALERALRSEKRVKLLYTVPNFQNPSGRTWSAERRRRLAALALRYNVPVIEDNPYGELCYDGTTPPCIQTLDEAGLVISLGTFSKIFCPGLRIGWIAAKRRYIDRYVILKQASDLHSSTLDQMLTAAYLEAHDIEKDLTVKRRVYGSRRDAMVEALEREMPEGVRFTRPRGGLFLWVELPATVDSRILLDLCLKRNVAFVPGGAFFPVEERRNTLRLNFSNMPEDRIREGIGRLAECLRGMIGGEEVPVPSGEEKKD